MPPLQTDTTVTDEASALYRLWHTPGYPRLIYGAYVLCGIIFYGIGIYTALGILMRFLDDGSIPSWGTALFLCYILLNSIIGYGFMFYRKWLLVAFASTLALSGFWALFSFVSGATSHALALRTGMFVTAGILLFLFLTRRFLSGRYLAPKAMIPFIVGLLASFLLTNGGVLH